MTDQNDLNNGFADTLESLLSTLQLQGKSIGILQKIVGDQQAMLKALAASLHPCPKLRVVRKALSLSRAKREIEELERRHSL